MKLIIFLSFAFIFHSIQAKEFELNKKKILNDKIEISIPEGFEIMSDEMLKQKYPSDRRPTLVYTNEPGSVNVGFNLTKNNATQELIPQYLESFKTTFKNLYPSAQWYSTGVEIINGRKVGCIELLTPAMDTEIYNMIFFTDLDGKLLLCTFNCTKVLESEYKEVAKKIMSSFQILN